MTLNQFTATRASGAVVLIRSLYVRPAHQGRHPGGNVFAYLDGVFEIGCGLLILVGLFTRLATMPMIIDMLGALAITKVPLLWGHAPLYPKEGGFWDFFHEGPLEMAMLCGSVFLLIVGAGAYSIDAQMNRDRTAAVVT